MSGLSNSKFEGNTSVGVLLDETWLEGKRSPDTSENFQLKIEEIKKKEKVCKVKIANVVNKPQKQIINIINPSKFLKNKNSKNNKNNEEDFCEDTETAHIGMVSVNPIKGGISELNNKENMYCNNYFIPQTARTQRAVIDNFRKIELENEFEE